MTALEPAADAFRVRLGAALFNGDHGRLSHEIARIESAGIDFVHLDVFDGHFVPELGFSPRTIADLRPLTKLPFEVHLGATEPLRILPALADAGVDLVLIHVESIAMAYETLTVARGHGCNVGLAVALGTSIASVEPLIPMVDAVLLLSRVTGEGTSIGSFDPRVYSRVRALSELVAAAGTCVDLQVAGGVRIEHVRALVEAGAATLAVGGGIYRAPDMERAVAQMRNEVTAIPERAHS